jgi:hypothetical protein
MSTTPPRETSDLAPFVSNAAEAAATRITETAVQHRSGFKPSGVNDQSCAGGE